MEVDFHNNDLRSDFHVNDLRSPGMICYVQVEVRRSEMGHGFQSKLTSQNVSSAF